MTRQQIQSLEWALSTLIDRFDGVGPDSDAHIAQLTELLDSAKESYWSREGHHSSLVAFMAKHGLTLPMAEFDKWRMVIPRDESLGTVLTCRSCKTVIRVQRPYAEWLSRTHPKAPTSLIVSERPDYCRCGADLAGTIGVPILSEYPLVGQIRGLPESYGTLRATNGILCWIEQSNGRIYEGHIEWFELDEKAKPVRINHDGTVKQVRVRKNGTSKADDDGQAALMALIAMDGL